MGKRELLLIVAFVIVGATVYYATAPSPAPGQQGLAVGTFFDRIRREVHGNRGSAEVKSTATVPLSSTITDIRIGDLRGAPLTIIGEDRADVASELNAWSNGYDDEEAKKYASATVLTTSEAGSSLAIGIDYPVPATQRASLTLRIPQRLGVRVQPSRGKIEISNVASAELLEARGQVAIREVAGRLVITQRGGRLNVEKVAALKLTSRGSTIELDGVKGEVSLQAQGGEVRARRLAGPIEIESSGARIVLEDLDNARKPTHVNATNGEVMLSGVRGETRIDGRDSRIEVKIDQPAPVAIYNESDQTVRVTLPSGGVHLDAQATDGRVSVPEGLIEVTTSGDDQRARGPINGGGPTITIRTSHSNVEVRSRSSDR
jgi:hypothetical protein